MKKNINVDEFMQNLDHPFKEGIEFLRQIIIKCDKDITEEIKWNAPSFKIKEHFATFKLYPPKSIQIILHTGAKKKENSKKFLLNEKFKFIKWITNDRCVITLKSNMEPIKLEKEISQIIKSWIKQLQ